MEAATVDVLKTLRQRGYRVTKAREHIVDVLARQAHPQTIQDIVADSHVDEASVYRTIDTLRSEGLVEEITRPGGKALFSLAHGHHHHVVCTSCGLAVHIPCEAVAPPQQLPHPFVAIEYHEVTFYGCCQSCG